MVIVEQGRTCFARTMSGAMPPWVSMSSVFLALCEASVRSPAAARSLASDVPSYLSVREGRDVNERGEG